MLGTGAVPTWTTRLQACLCTRHFNAGFRVFVDPPPHGPCGTCTMARQRSLPSLPHVCPSRIHPSIPCPWQKAKSFSSAPIGSGVTCDQGCAGDVWGAYATNQWLLPSSATATGRIRHSDTSHLWRASCSEPFGGESRSRHTPGPRSPCL